MSYIAKDLFLVADADTSFSDLAASVYSLVISSFICEICSSVRLSPHEPSFDTSDESDSAVTVSGSSRSSGMLMVAVRTPSSVFMVMVKDSFPSSPVVFCTSPSLERTFSQSTFLTPALALTPMLMARFLSSDWLSG